HVCEAEVLCARIRGCHGPLHGLADLRLYRLVNPLQLFHVRLPLREETICVEVERVLHALGLELRRAILLGVPGPVAAPAPRARLDQAWATALTRTRHCRSYGRAHRVDVVAVDACAWHAVAVRAQR